MTLEFPRPNWSPGTCERDCILVVPDISVAEGSSQNAVVDVFLTPSSRHWSAGQLEITGGVLSSKQGLETRRL